MSYDYSTLQKLGYIEKDLCHIDATLKVLTHHLTGWVVDENGYWHPPEEKEEE